MDGAESGCGVDIQVGEGEIVRSERADELVSTHPLVEGEDILSVPPVGVVPRYAVVLLRSDHFEFREHIVVVVVVVVVVVIMRWWW